jgi:hypothetical protein
MKEHDTRPDSGLTIHTQGGREWIGDAVRAAVALE